MSAHDQQRHAQNHDGVFHARGDASDVVAVAGNDVAGRALGEDFTRAGLHQHVGNDAGVSASEEHGDRLLLVLEIGEEVTLRGEDFALEFSDALDDFR